MIVSEPKVGFIGFGEAGYELAKGLKSEGLSQIAIYDKFQDIPPYDKVIKTRIKDINVKVFPNIQNLAEYSNLILSTVTVSAAKKVAKEISDFLENNKIYVDMNTSSPHTKLAIAKIINKTGAKFVDAAVMGAVSLYGHKVPILACGEGAKQFQLKMSNYGMNIRCIEGKVGSSSAVKMLRSVYMKGIEALLLETLIAAYRYGELELVLESITDSMKKRPFIETINMLVTTDVIHAKRRAIEMNEVITTLEEIGIEPIMSKATKNRLEWSAGLGLEKYFSGEIPKEYMNVLIAIDSFLKIKNETREIK